jgi:hypothetical protein
VSSLDEAMLAVSLSSFDSSESPSIMPLGSKSVVKGFGLPYIVGGMPRLRLVACDIGVHKGEAYKRDTWSIEIGDG